MSTYSLIDAPVSRASSLDEIDAWIKRLQDDYPQDDEGVQYALHSAERLREFVIQQQGADRGSAQIARRRGSAK